MNDNYDFDSDSVMGEDEQFAELDTFLIYLQELQDKPRAQIFNPARLKEFRYACKMIAKIIRAVSPDAKIEYSMSELGFGAAYIEVEADEITVTDVKEFVGVIKLSNNFEIHPLLNGNIKMSIMFHDVMVGMNLEEE